MVGIPGKLKGCHTCRRRRVKCDLGQPDCARCTQSGRACEGYQRNLVFINRTAAGLQRRQPLEEARPRQIPQSNVATAYGTEPRSVVNNRKFPDRVIQPQRLPPRIGSTNLRLKVYENLFLEDYLPRDPRLVGNRPARWLLESICVNGSSRALEFAKEALFLTRVGNLHNDRLLMIQGKARYGDALQELQKALFNERQVTMDETLSACNVLSLYEILDPIGSAVKGHLNHVSGIVKLLKHRQSNASQSPLCEALMDHIKYTTMISCVQHRTISVFGSLETIASLWPDAKTIEPKLYDKGFILANILADIDETIHPRATSETFSILGGLLDRLQVLEQGLTIWYGELLEVAESNLAWRGVLPQYQDLRKAIAFPDLRLAQLMLCFCTLRMLVIVAQISLYFTYLQSQEKDISGTVRKNRVFHTILNQAAADSLLGNSSAKDMLATGIQLTEVILSAVLYCTSDGMGLISCLQSLFGLRGALGILRFNPQYNERLKSCEALVIKLTATRGVGFAEDLARLSGKWGDTGEECSG